MSSIFHLRKVSVVLILMIVSCTGNEMIDPNKTVPDPEGTMTLDVSNSKIDNKIYQKDGNLTGGLFLNLGEMKGLGNITSIPKEGWVSTVALMEGYGYIAWANNKYYRIYGHILNEHQTVIKYQYPFLGSETSIKVKNVLSFTKDGGKETVVLDNKTLLPFSVSCSDSWINAQVVSSTSNHPYDAISVSVSSNSTIDNRKGSITVKSDVGESVSIDVEQGSGDAVLSVSPTSLSFDGIASSSTLSISSNAEYTVSSNQNWCTVNGKTVSVSENATGADRTATITVATKTGNVSKTVSVSQKKITLSISQTSFQFDGPSNNGSFTVNADGISSWSVTSDKEWCTVSKSGNNVNFTVSQNNSGSERTAQLTVTFPGTKGTVTIKQGIPTLSVSQSSFTFDWRQNEGQFSVSSDVSDWSVSCDANWISLSKNGDTISFTVKENENNDSRDTNIYTSLPDGRKKTTSITQGAMPSPFIDVSNQSVAANVDSYSFEVKSNIKWQVSVSSGIILKSASTCDKDGVVTIALNINTTQNINTYYVYIKPVDSSLSYLNKEVTITQRKVGRWFKSSISELKNEDVIVFVSGSKIGAGLYRNDYYHTIKLASCTISNNEITEMPANTIKIKVFKNGDNYRLMAINASYGGTDYSGMYLYCPGGNFKLDFVSGETLDKYSYYPSWTRSSYNSEVFRMKWDSSDKSWYLMAFEISSVYEISCRDNSSLGRQLSIYKLSDNY